MAPEQAIAFVNAINDNPGTKRLARVPYLLTLMALIHRKAARLPHGRTDLYDRISTAYLESIDARRNLDQVPYSLPQKKRWLAEAGYQMQLRRTKKRNAPAAEQADILVREKEVCEWLSKAMSESGAENPEEEAKTILDYIARRSGLLVPRGEGLFAFMHLSLQEYFAASSLEPRLTSSRFSKKQRTVPTYRQLRQWANQDEWLEVYVLLFELLAKKDATDTEEFFNFLFAERFTFDGTDGQSTAARLLAELVVDPFVALNASTRRRGRNICWKSEFCRAHDVHEPGWGLRDNSNISAIAQMLVAEQRGDLRGVWDAAGFTPKDLRESATFLNLTGCTSITDVEALSTLSQLKVLSLAGCAKLVDVSALSKLKKLVSLKLDGCRELNDLSPLGAIKSLGSLYVSGCTNVHNLALLAALKKLTHLELPPCESFDSLLPVASLTNLRTLSIDRLSVPVNLAHLKKCTSLTELIFGGSAAAQDLSPLSQLPNLSRVHFHDFPPDIDLAPFIHAPGIEDICLGGTRPTLIPDELVERGVLQGPHPTKQSRKRKSALSE